MKQFVVCSAATIHQRAIYQRVLMPFLVHSVLHDTIVLTHMAAGRMQLHARAKAWLSVQPYGQQ